MPADHPMGRYSGGPTSELVERLRMRILAGHIQAGERLPSEASLVDELGVEPTVVRDAITRLAAAGLVEQVPGDGALVLPLPDPGPFVVAPAQIRSDRDALDMIDFRIGVESEAAGLAADRRTELELKAIQRALVDLGDSGRHPSGAVEADFQFHLKVARASGNRFYPELISSLGPTMIMLPRTRRDPAYTVSDASHLTRVTLEHENIYAAIAAQDAAAARAAMRLHLSNSRTRLQST
ncbi:MAG TPA: FCD domain-containing protein [Dermatophilaceae bacterium]|nr:FCD domain-containing protein [Dermatophilaceae bacterium]